MANNLSNVFDLLLARSLPVLRNRAAMVQAVNMEYSSLAAEKGNVIDIPIPVDGQVSQVVPGSQPQNADSTTAEKVQVPLNNWWKASFHFTDKDYLEISERSGYIPMVFDSRIAALADKMNETVLENFSGVYNTVGSPTSQLFAGSGDNAGANNIIDAQRILTENKADTMLRRMVVNPLAYANAEKVSLFQEADKAGTAGTQITGSLGMKFGFDILVDQQVQKHTAGGSGTPAVNGNNAIGDNEISVDGLGNTGLNVGDVIKFSGGDQTYAVATAGSVSSNSQTITVSPKLVAAVANDETITVTATHRANLAFHRDAFVFVTRPLKTDDMTISQLTDPVTGLTLRVTKERQHFQDAYWLDCLWGTAIIRPELAVRMVSSD